MALDDIFLDKKVKRTKKEVFFWWERKRLQYNLVCFTAGIISILIIYLSIGKEFKEGALYLLLMAVLVVALMGNLCYFLGFFIEILTPRNEKTGPILFAIGTIFSVIILFIPAIFALILSTKF